MRAVNQPFLTGIPDGNPKSAAANTREPTVASRRSSNRHVFSSRAGQLSTAQRSNGTDRQGSRHTVVSSTPYRGRNPNAVDGTRRFGQETVRRGTVSSTGGSIRHGSRSERRAWGSRPQKGTTEGFARTGTRGKGEASNTDGISNSSSVHRRAVSLNADRQRVLSIRDIQRGLRKVSMVAMKPRTSESPRSDGGNVPEEGTGGVRQRRRGGNVGVRGGSFFDARDKKAEELFRGVSMLPGHPLCTDPDSVDGTEGRLWCGAACSEQDFSMSQPVDRVDWFVSHAWARDRRDPMFTSDHEYSAYKTAELEGAINDALAERRAVIPAGEKAGSSPDSSVMLEIQAQAKPLTLWIDKFCVGPTFLQQRLIVERHMEHFIQNSDGFLVLPSTSYFRRLWCVFEWGCFVASHGGDNLDRLRVCLTWLCSNPVFQIPLLARDLEIMSVQDLRCSESNDRQHIQGVIKNKYRSPERFLRMVQVSALCAFARTCGVLAFDFCTPDVQDVEEAWGIFDRHLRWRHTKFILPWQRVADKLGLQDLSTGLAGFWGQLRRSGKMEAEVSQPEEAVELFCVSAPSKKRLTTLATFAVSVHLASLVGKARAAALPLMGLAATSACLGRVNLMRRFQRNMGSIEGVGNGGVGGRGDGGEVVSAGEKGHSRGKAELEEEEEGEQEESGGGGWEESGGG